jgi:hypothetical protein
MRSHQVKKRAVLLAALAALLFADAWLAWTLVNALTSGEGNGSVFWTAIVLTFAILAALFVLTVLALRSLLASR